MLRKSHTHTHTEIKNQKKSKIRKVKKAKNQKIEKWKIKKIEKSKYQKIKKSKIKISKIIDRCLFLVTSAHKSKIKNKKSNIEK
jgi:hypothetical protein